MIHSVSYWKRKKEKRKKTKNFVVSVEPGLNFTVSFAAFTENSGGGAGNEASRWETFAATFFVAALSSK